MQLSLSGPRARRPGAAGLPAGDHAAALLSFEGDLQWPPLAKSVQGKSLRMTVEVWHTHAISRVPRGQPSATGLFFRLIHDAESPGDGLPPAGGDERRSGRGATSASRRLRLSDQRRPGSD